MRPQGRSTILENAGRVEVMTFLPWFALVKQGHPTPQKTHSFQVSLGGYTFSLNLSPNLKPQE